MDSDSDSYYEESSSDAEGGVPGSLLVNLEINLEESPQSPPLGSSWVNCPTIPVGELSPVWELPDDETNFMSSFTRTDVLELKQWAETTRNRRIEEGYVVEEPVLPQNFVAFLIEYHGTQWDFEFLPAAAEPLFAQLLAYVVVYARLTSHNKRIFRQWFGT